MPETRRAFLYNSGEAIQAVLCKDKEDKWDVCDFIFNKAARWDRKKAAEMAGKIDKKRILENLDVLNLEEPAQMLPAGCDFFQAMAKKEAEAKVEEVTVEKEEDQVPEIPDEELEKAVKEKEEKKESYSE